MAITEMYTKFQNHKLLRSTHFVYRFKLFITFIVLLIAPSINIASSQSSATTWSNPIILGDGWWQNLAVDQMGTVHVTWYGVIRENPADSPGRDEDLLMYTARPFDGAWSTPVDIEYTGRGGLTVRNAIAVNKESIVSVLYRAVTRHLFAQSHVTGATDAINWSPSRQLTESAYYLDLFVDRNDVLHAVSSAQNVAITNAETSTCAGCGDIIYSRSTDGGKNWSLGTNLSNLASGADKPDIWQGPSGRLYINWDSGFDWYVGRGSSQDVRLVYSDDEGETWSEPIVLRNEENTNLHPMQFSAVELPNGDLLAVWRYQELTEIYSQISQDSGLTWSEPEAIPNLVAIPANMTTLDDYDLVLDHLGNPQLFVVGQTEMVNLNAALGVYHVEYRQGAWQSPRLIFQAEGVTPRWPKAAVGPKNDIHLTWFVSYDRFPQGTITGRDIYYTYRSPTMPDAPFVAFNPTETPPTQAAFVAQLDPTSTPYPTVEPLDRDFQTSTSDLYVIRIFLGGLLAVVVFCIIVVILTGFRLRRP